MNNTYALVILIALFCFVTFLIGASEANKNKDIAKLDSTQTELLVALTDRLDKVQTDLAYAVCRKNGGVLKDNPILPLGSYYLGDSRARCVIGSTTYDLDKDYTWVSNEAKYLTK